MVRVKKNWVLLATQGRAYLWGSQVWTGWVEGRHSLYTRGGLIGSMRGTVYFYGCAFVWNCVEGTSCVFGINIGVSWFLEDEDEIWWKLL